MNSTIQEIWGQADILRGCLSDKRRASGRRKHISDEDPLAVSNLFVSDEAKLLSSKAFRKLGDKTQVFTRPQTSLLRNRLTHTLEVVACSVIASDMLGLNTNLVRAAAFGHDIGHVPFGHQGEAWMAKAMGKPFCHEYMGAVVAQHIERRGWGLNLTHETLEAMVCHSGNTARPGMSQEAWVLRYTDKFAYLFADINDIGGRMRYPLSKEIRSLADSFGSNQRERTTTAIAGLVIESAELGRVSFERSELGAKMKALRTLMNEVYPRVTQQNIEVSMASVFEFLEALNIADPFLLLALMTDTDIIQLSRESMKDMAAFNRTTAGEMVQYLEGIGKVDLCDPDLNW